VKKKGNPETSNAQTFPPHDTWVAPATPKGEQNVFGQYKGGNNKWGYSKAGDCHTFYQSYNLAVPGQVGDGRISLRKAIHRLEDLERKCLLEVLGGSDIIPTLSWKTQLPSCL